MLLQSQKRRYRNGFERDLAFSSYVSQWIFNHPVITKKLCEFYKWESIKLINTEEDQDGTQIQMDLLSGTDVMIEVTRNTKKMNLTIACRNQCDNDWESITTRVRRRSGAETEASKRSNAFANYGLWATHTMQAYFPGLPKQEFWQTDPAKFFSSLRMCPSIHLEKIPPSVTRDNSTDGNVFHVHFDDAWAQYPEFKKERFLCLAANLKAAPIKEAKLTREQLTLFE